MKRTTMLLSPSRQSRHNRSSSGHGFICGTVLALVALSQQPWLFASLTSDVLLVTPTSALTFTKKKTNKDINPHLVDSFAGLSVWESWSEVRDASAEKTDGRSGFSSTDRQPREMESTSLSFRAKVDAAISESEALIPQLQDKAEQLRNALTEVEVQRQSFSQGVGAAEEAEASTSSMSYLPTMQDESTQTHVQSAFVRQQRARARSPQGDSSKKDKYQKPHLRSCLKKNPAASTPPRTPSRQRSGDAVPTGESLLERAGDQQHSGETFGDFSEADADRVTIPDTSPAANTVEISPVRHVWWADGGGAEDAPSTNGDESETVSTYSSSTSPAYTASPSTAQPYPRPASFFNHDVDRRCHPDLVLHACDYDPANTSQLCRRKQEKRRAAKAKRCSVEIIVSEELPKMKEIQRQLTSFRLWMELYRADKNCPDKPDRVGKIDEHGNGPYAAFLRGVLRKYLEARQWIQMLARTKQSVQRQLAEVDNFLTCDGLSGKNSAPMRAGSGSSST